MVGEHGGTAAAEDLRVRGERADERDALRVPQGQHAGFVAEQHERPVRDLARDRITVHIGRFGRGGVAERAGPVGEQEHAAHHGVDHCFVGFAATHRFGEPVAEHRAGAGHGHVEAAVGGGDGVARGQPVGDDEAVETPFAAQHAVDEFGVLGHRGAVDTVVGGHDPPRLRAPDDELERREVELAQGTLAHAHVDGEAFGLEVVGDEVLDRDGDPAVLHAGDVAGADHPGEEGVFGVALEVPSTQWRAVEVDRRGEQHVHALAPGFLREQAAGLDRQARVPARGERGRAGQRHRGVVRAPVRPADTHRAVGEHQGGEPDPRQRGQRPDVLTGEQARLRVQVEFGQQGVDVEAHAHPPGTVLLSPYLAMSSERYVLVTFSAVGSGS